VVFEGEIVVAYQRTPPSIVGDGFSTVSQLVEACQQQLYLQKRDAQLSIDDYRVQQNIQRIGLDGSSLLPQGQRLTLLSNANMSSGGTALELTDQIHSSYRDLCINVCKDMGLRICGVDLLTNDITQPLSDYVILEVNSTPGLRHFASLGEAQERKVYTLFLRMLMILEAR